MYKRLSPKEKTQLIKRIISGEKVSEVCRQTRISRTILYRWIQTYKKVGRIEGRKKARHPKSFDQKTENKILKLAITDPSYSPHAIARILHLGHNGVWLVLKRNNLNTQDKRHLYLQRFGNTLIKVHPVTDKTTMIRRIENGEKISAVCREFGVSRTVFYRWLRRYQDADEGKEREALAIARPTGERHWRYIPGAREFVLRIVQQHPEFSAHAISKELVSSTGNKMLGHNGVHNLLKRLYLNTYQRRLAYVKAQEAIITPTPQVERGWRIPIFGEIPSLSALAPPGFFNKLISSRFFLPFLSVIIIGFIFSVVLSNLGYQQGIVGKIGILFSFVALFFGMFFFIYSLKYYLTIAIVLSFSRQNPSTSLRTFGPSGLRDQGLGKAPGLRSDVSNINLQRHPFVSIHIASYNEKRVVERLLKAATSMDYSHLPGVPQAGRQTSQPRLTAAQHHLEGGSAAYEVVIVDDSTDDTTQIIDNYLQKSTTGITSTTGEEWTLKSTKVHSGVTIKHIHRSSREGFKGGALREALKATDPRAEFVMVLDADFIPYPDTIVQFLKYFQATAGTLDFTQKWEVRSEKIDTEVGSEISNFPSQSEAIPASHIQSPTSKIAAIQGYQWHVLNKSENWITRGVRSEYAGSYVIERSGEEIYSGLKQISGSVYMIRRDVLESIGWGTSLTEDFQLTLKLYELGYKVIYTPYIQAPAESVSTIKRLIRQRMRWAEGHSHNIRKMFGRLLFGKWEVRNEKLDTEVGSEKSHLSPQSEAILASHLPPHTSKQWKPSPLTLPEKLEFLYLSPYYLQAAFFILGTFSWFIAEVIFKVRLPFWTEVWGWSLVFTNLLALPLMNMVGLFLEESNERDYLGLISFIILSYIVAPFQGYAAVRGFLTKEEGPWFRTPKTGRITDEFMPGRLYRFVRGIFGKPAATLSTTNIALMTTNIRSDSFSIGLNSRLQGFFNLNFNLFGRRSVRFAYRHIFTKAVLAGFMAIVMFINYMAFFVYDTSKPQITPIKEPMSADKSVQISEAPAGADNQLSSAGSEASSGGQVITEIDKEPVITNLVENQKALALIHLPGGGYGQAYAAESTSSAVHEVYRWEVKFDRGTTYYFGLQEPEGIRPVVKIRNGDGWFVKYEPTKWEVRNEKLDNEMGSGKPPRTSSIYVIPKVTGNSIEWTLSNGIVAKYTALKDRVKADYIVSNRDALINADDSGLALNFVVEYNDFYAGDTQGHLKHELLPTGDIAWLGENGMTIFEMPKPVIKEDTRLDVGSGKLDNEVGSEKEQPPTSDPSFTVEKVGRGTSLLSIVVPDGLNYPLTIDPVIVDSAATTSATGTLGRNLLRDAFGNLIVLCNCGTGNDHVWYKNNNASSWTDAGIDLDGSSNASIAISADLDSTGSAHVAFRENTVLDVSYMPLLITRDSSNAISSIGTQAVFDLDTAAEAVRSSLIVANKNEGAGKEKIVVAWSMNSTGGGNRGEMRFLQCDLADPCNVAANWKNASEEVNGSGTCTDGTAGMPNAVTCAGASDVIFQNLSDTNHGAYLSQVPGRPARTPTGAFKNIDGTLTALTNAIDDNTGTTADINSLDNLIDFMYVGDTFKFSRIVNDITNTNVNFATFTTREYCSANSNVATTCDTWTAVSNFIDNTANADGAYREDGSILFDEPSNWVESTEGPGGSTVQGFWVRLRPSGAFDTTVSIAELEVTDRHSKDLLLVGSVDATDDLRAAYVPWDFVGQGGWENNPADADDPWRADTGGTSSALSDTGGNVSTGFNNAAANITADLINNNVYVSYLNDLGALGVSAEDSLTVERIPNTLDLTITANWSDTVFPAVTEAVDVVFKIASDGSDIYLFYVLDPDTNSAAGYLVWRKCTPSGGGDGNICDVTADWGSEISLVNFSSTVEEPTHPSAILSKAVGDTVAIDVIYTNILATATLKYERHFVDMANITEVVAASGDDALHRDCDSGTDDQVISGTTIELGREADDAGCSPTTVESENHVGFRFTTLNVSQGARISSAYLDFRVFRRLPNGTNPVDFTIYGEDTNDSAAFSASTDCTDPCSGAVGERTQTTSSTVQSIDFTGTDVNGSGISYRIDVTDLVQEVICRGINDTQPCVGNFNGNGLTAWAANNNLALLLISAEGGTVDNNALITSQDNTATVMLDPTLQINCSATCSTTGSLGRNYTLGLRYPHQGSGSTTDLGHPISALQFGQVGTDDTLFATVSASMDANATSSAVPIYIFKANNSNNNNTDEIQITVILKSSIPAKSYGGPHATGREIRLEVYRDGTTDNWVPPPSGTWNTTTALGDTDTTLTGTVNSNISEYYNQATAGGTCSGTGNDCWAYWRLWQDRAYDANQIFYVDFVSFTFVPENILWLLPMALFLPRIVQWYNRRGRPNTLILTNEKRI